MPTLSNHGGGCCGARHIHTFNAGDNADPNRILRVVDTAPRTRRVEVILADYQVRDYPRITETLARLGFVLTDRYVNGNHGSQNYVFSRCDRRLPLTDLPFQWRGMVASPHLHGNLPGVGTGARYRTVLARHETGSRVRLLLGRSPFNGHEGVIVDRFNQECTVVLDGSPTRRRYDINCLRLLPVDDDEGPWNFPPMLHLGMDDPLAHLEDRTPPPVTVVRSMYANVYARAGRTGIHWSTLELAARAGERRRLQDGRGPTRTDRLDFMSDGSERWTEGVGE